MASANDVDIDVVGHDRTEAAFRSVERGLKRLGSSMGTATRTMAKAGAMVASFSSLLGPAAIGTAKVVTATAKMGASLAPLIAFLPALAGGFALIKLTLTGMGPAMGAALTPTGDAFKRAQEHAGKLAAQGLPALAKAFNRLNMPTISLGMDSIARSTNKSVTMFGRWANSAPGMKVIGDVTDGTARAFAKIAPAVTRAAIALLNMTGRAGVADRLSALGGSVAALAGKFERWANSKSSADITRSLNLMKDAGGALGGKLVMVKDAIEWIGANPDKIKAMSDALAGIGIALGLAGGAWVAVVAGAVTLIANHWDTLKPKFEAAAKWANATWDAIANDPNVQRIGAALATIGRAIKDDFVAAWALLKPKLDAAASAAQGLWEKMGPFVAQVLENPDVRNGLRIIAMGLAAVAAAMIVVSAVTASTAAAVIGGLAAMAAYMIGVFARTIAAAVAAALIAFGHFASGVGGIIKHIPGLGGVGRALEGAGKSALTAAGKVQSMADSLNRVRSKTVTLTLNQVINRNFSGNAPGPWAGGYVGIGAVGGVVTRPTRAVIGEAGPEMVVPLNRMPGASPLPAGGSSSGGDGGNMYLTVNVTQPLGTAAEIAAAVQNAVVSASSGMSLRPMAQAIARAS